MSKVTFSIRIDEEIRNKFKATCEGIGISPSDAICIFAKKVIQEHCIPFELDTTKESVKKRKESDGNGSAVSTQKGTQRKSKILGESNKKDSIKSDDKKEEPKKSEEKNTHRQSGILVKEKSEDSISKHSTINIQPKKVVVRPEVGIPFDVNPASIDQMLFGLERKTEMQTSVQNLIVGEFQCVPNESFRLLIPNLESLDRYRIPERIYGMNKIAKDLGGRRLANYTELIWMWAQCIQNGISWDELCDEPDWIPWHRAVELEELDQLAPSYDRSWDNVEPGWISQHRAVEWEEDYRPTSIFGGYFQKDPENLKYRYASSTSYWKYTLHFLYRITRVVPLIRL